MSKATDELDPSDVWVAGVLNRTTRTRDVVVLDRADVDHYGDLVDVIAFASARGWRVAVGGNDVVVFCHQAPIHLYE